MDDFSDDPKLFSAQLEEFLSSSSPDKCDFTADDSSQLEEFLSSSSPDKCDFTADDSEVSKAKAGVASRSIATTLMIRDTNKAAAAATGYVPPRFYTSEAAQTAEAALLAKAVNAVVGEDVLSRKKKGKTVHKVHFEELLIDQAEGQWDDAEERQKYSVEETDTDDDS